MATAIKRVRVRKRIKSNPYRNDFSFKKLVKDVVNLHTAPIKQTVSSVTGKPANIKYETGFGKLVGGAQNMGDKALKTAVKGFADGVTGGAATNLANLVRKDEYKEKAFQYNEMSPLDSGIKALDKVSQPLTKASAVLGGLRGGGPGAASAALTTPMYNKGIVPGDQDKTLTDQVLDEEINAKPGDKVLDDMVSGNEVDGGSDIEREILAAQKQDQNKLAGFDSLLQGNNLIIIAAVIIMLLLMLTKKK